MTEKKKRQLPVPGEWQREPGPYGRLFRTFGDGCIEYEPDINGIPKSIYFASKKAQEEQKKQKEGRS